MSAETRKKDLRALVQVCFPDASGALFRFKKVAPILEVQFHLPEIDFVRTEIVRCYLTGCFQACITLTNHLLERYCKLVLIAKEQGDMSFKDLDTLEERFAPALQKYMDKDLSDTLRACKTQGILSKGDYKTLDQYRDIFRNGFGHADASKILRGAKGQFAQGSFTDPSKLDMKVLTFEKAPFLHGIAVQKVAEANAWPYFVAIENFIRSSIRHYIKDQYEFTFP